MVVGHDAVTGLHDMDRVKSNYHLKDCRVDGRNISKEDVPT